MQVGKYIECPEYPCTDVKHDCYIVPDIEVKPEKISIVMISEAAPDDPVKLTLRFTKLDEML